MRRCPREARTKDRMLFGSKARDFRNLARSHEYVNIARKSKITDEFMEEVITK